MYLNYIYDSKKKKRAISTVKRWQHSIIKSRMKFQRNFKSCNTNMTQKLRSSVFFPRIRRIKSVARRKWPEMKRKKKNLASGRVKSIIGRISGAWGGTYFDDTPFCLWLTIRGGRIRVAHPRKHQTRVSRQKSGGYPVATRRNQPRGIPPLYLLLFSPLS